MTRALSVAHAGPAPVRRRGSLLPLRSAPPRPPGARRMQKSSHAEGTLLLSALTSNAAASSGLVIPSPREESLGAVGLVAALFEGSSEEDTRVSGGHAASSGESVPSVIRTWA